MKPKPTLIPFLLLLLLLLLSTSTSSAADTITLNSTLYASSPNLTWTSPSATFVLGFTAAASAHYVSITRNDLHVWTAGGTSPGGGAADATASLRLLPDGNLRLVNGSSGAVVWQSNTTGRGVSSAALNDSGNFVLLNGTVPIWSTFDYPTNTILPSQNFTTSRVLRSGLYSFSLLPSGNVTLKWNDTIVYWNSGLNSSITTNLTSPSLGFQSIGILSLYDPTLPSAVVMAYSSDYAEGTDVFRFLRLDSDGNLRIYSYAQGSDSSTERWAAVADQCLVFGYCGNFGICSYNDTGPVCECPSLNFEPIDPMDSRKGCKRKVEIADCPGSGAMLQLDHAKFLTYPPELASQVFFAAISACGLNCLVSSPCIASTSLSDGTGLCYQKTPDFVSGYQSPALPSTSFVKVCGPVVGNPSPSEGVTKGKSSSLHSWMLVVAVIGSISGLVMFEGGLWWWCCRNRARFGASSAQYALIEYASGAPVQFSYKELQRATKGFRDKLGAGGFGAGNVKGIVDKRLPDYELDMEQVIRVIQVSFWCIQEQPTQRPMMGKVVQMLEGIVEMEKPPPPKAAAEGSGSGTSMNISGSVSTFAASAPGPSSSSSFRTAENSSFVSQRNWERATSASFTT
ncbi:hypothetical protein RHGRI_031586 [Rhododendron griersonianum]|uniref:Bulb-type lectin domain-containing protein n=1 Tax=Rhododendron griersonianum TaxID=479676 RepID=A0AAV6I8H5_9ERIC|nr:hypothetical protein RHGRI_031586 [Rhododendron griersonianum]